jgi:DNA-binding beta-propeller fold protein YncE
MEFDPQGNLVNSWGDAKVLGNYLHDCQVDKNGNVWIAPARSGFVQKYSHDGKLLLQIGKSGVFDSSDGTAKGKPLNSDAAQFFGPSAVDVDPENGDVYVADGHGGGNTRIAVLDKNGTFLRQWRLHHTEAKHRSVAALHEAVQGRAGVRVRPAGKPAAGVRQDGQLQEEHRHSVDELHQGK